MILVLVVWFGDDGVDGGGTDEALGGDRHTTQTTDTPNTGNRHNLHTTQIQ